MRFTWDLDKAAANLAKHGVRFDQALRVFLDPAHTTEADTSDLNTYEDRWNTYGRIGGTWIVLRVTWTDREPDVCRIISARKATPSECARYHLA